MSTETTNYKLEPRLRVITKTYTKNISKYKHLFSSPRKLRILLFITVSLKDIARNHVHFINSYTEPIQYISPEKEKRIDISNAKVKILNKTHIIDILNLNSEAMHGVIPALITLLSLFNITIDEFYDIIVNYLNHKKTLINDNNNDNHNSNPTNNNMNNTQNNNKHNNTHNDNHNSKSTNNDKNKYNYSYILNNMKKILYILSTISQSYSSHYIYFIFSKKFQDENKFLTTRGFPKILKDQPDFIMCDKRTLLYDKENKQYMIRIWKVEIHNPDDHYETIDYGRIIEFNNTDVDKDSYVFLLFKDVNSIITRKSICDYL